MVLRTWFNTEITLCLENYTIYKLRSPAVVILLKLPSIEQLTPHLKIHYVMGGHLLREDLEFGFLFSCEVRKDFRPAQANPAKQVFHKRKGHQNLLGC